MLEVKDVTYSYHRNNTAVKNVDLVIEEGSIVGVAGHNGAGKTTLLRIISGMLKPESGTVSFSPEAAKGEIAYVPDNGGFYQDLAAMDNVLFRMNVAQAKPTKELAMNYLEQVGLLEHSDKLAGTFSHGMKKRLALACAFASQPRFVILDESLNGIDPESLETISELLRKAALNGSTVLISSHDLNLLEGICSSILIMNRSQCVFFEAVEQLEESIKSIYFKKTVEK